MHHEQMTGLIGRYQRCKRLRETKSLRAGTSQGNALVGAAAAGRGDVLSGAYRVVLLFKIGHTHGEAVGSPSQEDRNNDVPIGAEFVCINDTGKPCGKR